MRQDDIEYLAIAALFLSCQFVASEIEHGLDAPHARHSSHLARARLGSLNGERAGGARFAWDHVLSSHRFVDISEVILLLLLLLLL